MNDCDKAIETEGLDRQKEQMTPRGALSSLRLDRQLAQADKNTINLQVQINSVTPHFSSTQVKDLVFGKKGKKGKPTTIAQVLVDRKGEYEKERIVSALLESVEKSHGGSVVKISLSWCSKGWRIWKEGRCDRF